MELTKEQEEAIITNAKGYATKLSVIELEELLDRLAILYDEGTSKISDELYDIMEEVLRKRNPNSEYFKQIAPLDDENKVRLPYYMGSLDKARQDNDVLDKWLRKNKGEYVISDKLDGVSGLLVNSNNKFKLYTRGDGEYGRDISHLIKYINIGKNIPNNIAIRGELIISKKGFEELQKKYKFENARNCVIGLIGSKNLNEDIAKELHYVVYEIINPRFLFTDQFNLLKSYTLDVASYIIKKDINVEFLTNYLTERKEKGEYEQDGIVIMDSSKIHKIERQKHPSYGIAFKINLNGIVTEVEEVEWNISKHEYLKPRIRIKPIKLKDVTITYLSGKNAKYIVDNIIGKGSKLRIIRSGDVIPDIQEIISPSITGKPDLPESNYKWNKTKVDLVAIDIYGTQKENLIKKQILHFFKTIRVKFMGEGVIDKLVDRGYDTIDKIVSAKEEDLVKIEGLGKKSIEKLMNNMKSKLNSMELYEFMVATNKFGRGLGTKKIKQIIDNYPDIYKSFNDKEKIREMLIKLDGFDTITINSFIDGIVSYQEFYNSLNSIYDISHIYKIKQTKKDIIKENKLSNKNIVFTGFRDKELQKKVENLGATVKETVTKNIDIVVKSDDEGISSKIKKALELNIRIMTKEEFIQYIE